jgi:hypothetical protein
MPGPRKLVLATVAGAVAVALVQPPAAADVVIRKDPKDTAGRLDIRRVAHGHDGDDAVTHKITTYRRFPSRVLKRQRTRFEVVIWDRHDRWAGIVFIWWRNGRLQAPIFDLYHGHRIGSAEVTRPNRRTVMVRIKLTDLGEPPGFYDWKVFSYFKNKGACGQRWRCMDEAPERFIRHRIPDAPEESGEGG